MIQTKVFMDNLVMNKWLRDNSEWEIIDIKFNILLGGGFIDFRYLVIYEERPRLV